MVSFVSKAMVRTQKHTQCTSALPGPLKRRNQVITLFACVGQANHSLLSKS